jgi:hypothetical protein
MGRGLYRVNRTFKVAQRKDPPVREAKKTRKEPEKETRPMTLEERREYFKKLRSGKPS